MSEKNISSYTGDVYDFHEMVYTAVGHGHGNFPGKCQRMLYTCYVTFVRLSYFVQLSLFFYELTQVYNNIPILSFTLSFTIFATGGVVFILALRYKIEELDGIKKRLRENLNLPWLGKQDWEKEITSRNMKYYRYVSILVYSIIGFGGLATIAMPLVTNSKQKFLMPFSYQYLAKTPYYAPIYMIHTFIISNFLLSFASNEMIYIGLILRLCSNLELVEYALNNMKFFVDDFEIRPIDDSGLEEKICRGSSLPLKFGKMSKEDLESDLIKKCIIHHQAVLREMRLIINIYITPLILHFIFGPALLTFLAYVVFSDLDEDGIVMQQIVYVVPVGAFLLVFCYFGTRLADKFDSVRFAFYSCPWYEMDLETRKLIVMVLLGLGKMGKLKTGTLFEVALTTYLSFAKITYNMVTLLRNTT